MMQVGLGFGALLERFLVDFGSQVGRQVGTKLTPKSGKKGSQDDVKKMIEKCFPKSHAGPRRSEGVVPYDQPIQSFQGPTCALDTPLGH